MHTIHTIKAFSALGQLVRNFVDSPSFEEFSFRVTNANNWFTHAQLKHAFTAIGSYLTEEQLSAWLQGYEIPDPVRPKKIGILMAGNVPAVGFHDLLAVLVTGHHAYVKLSSTDAITIPWLVNELREIAPELAKKVFFQEFLKGMDAYIATGSDNSARYFHYYFGKYPHIIRKNRTSIAVLTGKESSEDWLALGKDIFQYYGLGCRNVSKLYVPTPETLQSFLDGIKTFDWVAEHHKYFNNYEYNKSIFLINKVPHLDNGFVLVQENTSLVSPIATLYFECYQSEGNLRDQLLSLADKVQVIVSKDGWFENSIPFGEAQCPSLNEYADKVDTIAFLTKLTLD
jgi:hypothetical protein